MGNKTTKTLLLSILFLIAVPVFAEGAGLNINYNKFNLRVEFNDNADDEITGMEYIRQPSGLLFDLIHLVQSNKETVASLETEIFDSIDNNARYILISKNKPEYERIRHEKNLKSLDKDLLFGDICKAVTGKKCARPAEDSSTLFYLSDTLLMPVNGDLVDFGCFPCRNNSKHTFTKRFNPTKPNSQPAKFKKVTLTKKTICHYFNKLM